ncbi:MAG TPA: DUF177 domain-containing protein [Gemmatimonadota bacterium]|nr:DUF177 domain-containing protein [Gemmatimonadota bacterium]
MFVDLSRLEDGHLSQTFEIDRESPILRGLDAEIREPLTFDVEVRNPSGGTYVVTGRLEGEAMAPCRRCLTPTRTPLDVRLRLVYQEAGRDAKPGGDSGDDDVVWLKRGATRIELDGQVRDRLFLETERFPICRGDCKGICPQCGQNLNEGPCDCPVETADTRWKALEGLELGARQDRPRTSKGEPSD